MKSFNNLWIISLGIILLAAPVSASQEERTEALVANELKTLSQSINSLTRQLESQSQNTHQDTKLRKLDIAISYLNFRSRRIEMFERELQTARSSRNRLEDLLEQFRREDESLSDSFDGNQEEALQRAREELSFRREVVKNRINRAEEEIILLENRIMDMQSQIDSVESYVQKNLEF